MRRGNFIARRGTIQSGSEPRLRTPNWLTNWERSKKITESHPRKAVPLFALPLKADTPCQQTLRAVWSINTDVVTFDHNLSNDQLALSDCGTTNASSEAGCYYFSLGGVTMSATARELADRIVAARKKAWDKSDPTVAVVSTEQLNPED